jgi:AmmeMemoRadiSam system protein B
MIPRNAMVEGRFYPSGRKRMFDQIRSIEEASRYSLPDIETERILGAVLPHAGHLYSGHQTVPFFKLIRNTKEVPLTFVIVHPNHTGRGIPVALDDSDSWVNSAGEVPLDRELAAAMALPFDRQAHQNEHSAEVIIPFIQYFLGYHPFLIVPVCMRDQGYEASLLVAGSIFEATRITGRRIMLLASSDFSHYLSPEQGRIQDQFVIEEILARNARGVEQAVNSHRVSMCGYGPVMVLMEYSAMILPDYRIRILAQGHSGEVIPSPEVVDYISLITYK